MDRLDTHLSLTPIDREPPMALRPAQRAYEDKAREKLAAMRHVERGSLIPRMLGVVLLVGCAVYAIGFGVGVW